MALSPVLGGASGLGRIDADQPPAAQIYDALKAAILRMDLPPGSLVSETELGHAMGASRTPVRAALARLRDEGLIETRPSRGNFVTKLSPGAIRAANLIRRGIESATVQRLCASGLAPAAADGLARNIEASAVCVAAADGPGFSALDDRFHILLADATGLPRIAASLAREKVVLDRLRVLSLDDPAHLRNLLADHRAIVEAIGLRDAARALGALGRHLDRVLTTLDDLQRRNLEYFE